MVHKIALNGYGRIGREIITAGSYSVNYSGCADVCSKGSGMQVLQVSDLKNVIKLYQSVAFYKEEALI